MNSNTSDVLQELNALGDEGSSNHNGKLDWVDYRVFRRAADEIERLRGSVRRVRAWASDPDVATNPTDTPYYGDAQLEALGLLMGEAPDVSKWVKGEYREENDG